MTPGAPVPRRLPLPVYHPQGERGSQTCRAERSRYNECMENQEHPKITIDDLARMVENGFAEVREKIDAGVGSVREDMKAGFAAVDKRFAVMGQRIDQLDMKIDQHREETKADHAALRGVVGGMSHTLTDHEERIKALE
jgi:hypothetical protein